MKKINFIEWILIVCLIGSWYLVGKTVSPVFYWLCNQPVVSITVGIALVVSGISAILNTTVGRETSEKVKS